MEEMDKRNGVNSTPPTWLIIVMLFVFCPVGIFLMWKYTDWHKVVKIVVSVFLGLCLIVGMAGGSTKDEDDKKADVKQDVQQEQIVEDSVTDITSDDFVKALNSFLNDDAFIMNETLLGCKVDKDVVKIDIDLKSIDESWKQFTPDVQVENSFDCIVDSITTDCLMDNKYVDMWKSLVVTFYDGDQKIASIKRDKSDVKYEKSQEGTEYENDFYYFDYELSDFKWFIDKNKLDKTTQYEISKKKEPKKNDVKSDDNKESDKTPLEEAYDMGKQWIRTADWDAVFPYGCKIHDIIDYSCKESEPESAGYGKYCASVGMDLKNVYGTEFKSLMLVFMDENCIMTHVFYREADGSYVEIPLDNIPIKSY